MTECGGIACTAHLGEEASGLSQENLLDSLGAQLKGHQALGGGPTQPVAGSHKVRRAGALSLLRWADASVTTSLNRVGLRYLRRDTRL